MDAKQSAIEIVKQLQSNGHKALFAGGCVRDHLLGREPKDWDVATSATPDEVTAIFPRTLEVGKSFGVVRVVEKISDESIVTEVATFRKDGEYSDSRRPDQVVLITDEKEDAARRDFTINSMFMDPISGDIIDHFDGQSDLRQGIIRAVGDPVARIEEDALRMMRACRFASQLGFRVEDDLKEAVSVYQHKIQFVSWERIAEEFTKILASPKPSVGLQLLMDTRIMHRIIPEAVRMVGEEQCHAFHQEGDCWNHVKIVCDLIDKTRGDHLVWGAFLHDIGKPETGGIHPRRGHITHYGHDLAGAKMVPVIMERFKLPTKMIKAVADLARFHMKMHRKDMRPAKVAEIITRDDIHDLIALQTADSMSNKDKETKEYWLAEIEAFKQNPHRGRDGKVRPFVTGKVLRELGYEPGPEYQTIIDKAKTRQLDRDMSEEETIAYARQIADSLYRF